MYKKYLSEYKEEDRFDEYQLSMQRRCHRGKVMVYIIAICNIIFTLIGNILGDFNLINIIIQIGLSMALLLGVNWVRWFFVVGAVLSGMVSLYIFTHIIVMENQISTILVVVSILTTVQSVISGGLLAFNKSISEFFYDQQTK